VAYPNIKQDANGNYYVQGIQEANISQQQYDYNEIVQASQYITGPEGDAARKTISSNPNASAGIIAGLYKNGSIGNSDLVNTFLKIDKETADQRAKDAFEEAQKISKQNFQKTIWGRAWQDLKFSTRGAGMALFTPIESFFGGLRNKIAVVAKLKQLEDQGKIDTWGNPTNPGDTKESLGIPSILELLNPFNNLKQTTTFQAAKQGVTEGFSKIDLGEGFFPSEESGAGFKARQEQMKYGKVAVIIDGEQAKDAEGNLIYRPYSPIDPVSFIMTGGHLEDGNARFINAIGELGFMVVGDPAAAYAKLARSKKQLEQAVKFAGGVKTAKEAQKLTLLETQIAEKALETDRSLEALQTGRVDGKLSLLTQTEREAAYKTALEAELKLRDEKGAISLNYGAVADFLSGPKGSHIIDAIANLDDYKAIRAISKKGGKPGFTVDQSIALANAKNREEVLAAIAPYIAEGSVAQNLLESGNVTSRLLSKIVPGKVAKPAQGITGWAAKGIRKVPYIEKGLTGLSKSYSTYVPNTGSFVHFADKDALIDTITSYGRSTKLDEATIASLVDEVAFAKDASTAGFNATTKLFNAIFESNKAAFAKAGISNEKLTELTRVFDADRKTQSSYWAELHASGANIDFVFAGGKKISLSGPHLESEFLNSMIYFPAAKEIMAEIAKVGRLSKATLGVSGKVTQPLDAFTNQFWKKVVLTRPAYVIRNISEEQIRVMATGHASFFSNPIVAMGMWLGREGGPKWKSVLNSFDPYRHTVAGKNFKLASSADELAHESLAHDTAFDDYLDFMAMQSWGASSEIEKIAGLRGYKNVQYGEPGFWDGIANEIRILRQSNIAKVVARTEPGREKATLDYFLRGEGKDAWARLVNARNEKVKAWLLTDEGARAYLFDGVTDGGRAASLRARIEEVAGQGGESSAAIRKLIADGSFETTGYSLRVPVAEDSAINSIKNSKAISENRKSIKDANQVFAGQLEKLFKDKGNWNGIRFKVPDPTTVITTGAKGRINDLVDKFFDHAIQFEKTTTMGPEWRMKYWDVARTMALSADETAIQLMRSSAEKSLRPIIGFNGARLGDKHAAWDILNKAKGDGPLSIDEIHQYASRAANQHVAELFYNASKKRLLWHQLRLIAPFGQAWGDTATKWSKLAFDNPDQVYKIGRGLNWIQSPESSALYQFTDAKDYYDPNQGFFFTDPQSGQRQFFVPFMSTGMNFMTNLFRGKVSTQGAFAAAANPQSFNFALGSGVVLPGFGPGVSFGLNILDSLSKNPLDKLPPAWKDSMYKLIYPFGQPDLSTASGAISSITSANIGRVFAGVSQSEESYAASFAPVMNYLASGGEYDLDNPEDQTRLVADTNKFAQYFMFMRGIFGFASPVAIQPKDLTKDKDGNLMLSSALYADFRALEEESGSNRNTAYAKFLDLYGPEQVFAIISSTSGGPNNLYTYKMIMDDPSVVDQYSDTYGYFYPNGGFSQELYRWQMRNNKRERLTSQEILEKATNVRYYAAKDRLLARSVGEGWDSKRLEVAMSQLSDSYELRNRKVIFDASKEPRVLAQLQKAAYDERFIDSDAVTGLRDYLYLRDQAIEASGRVTLKNQSSLPQREWLAQQALVIIQKHPEFQKLYYSFFKKELEG
jgi:hypothetical protein